MCWLHAMSREINSGWDGCSSRSLCSLFSSFSLCVSPFFVLEFLFFFITVSMSYTSTRTSTWLQQLDWNYLCAVLTATILVAGNVLKQCLTVCTIYNPPVISDQLLSIDSILPYGRGKIHQFLFERRERVGCLCLPPLISIPFSSRLEGSQCRSSDWGLFTSFGVD
jgi:hypothetical protein